MLGDRPSPSPSHDHVGALSCALAIALAGGCAHRDATRATTPTARRAPTARTTAATATPRRAREPSPATQVEQVALAQETAAAREPRNQRTGTATRFEPTVRPVAFRTVDGKDGWRVSLGGGRPLATPAVAEGAVYVGGGFGSHEFYAFDAHTGEARWALRVSDDGPTAAVVADGVVAFNTESCTLFVVDKADGRALWSRWLGDPLMSQPAIGEGKLFMAFPTAGGHRLVAFALRTGEELWRVPIAGDVITAPVVYGDSVYAATFDGTVYRHRIRDGGLAWRRQLSATSAPWLDGDDVFVSRRQETLPDNAAPGPAHGMLMLAPLLHLLFLQSESVYRFSGDAVHGSLAPRAAPADSGGSTYHRRNAPWLNSDVQRRSRYNESQRASDTSVGFATTPETAQAAAAEANVGQGTVRGLWEYQGSRPALVDGRLFITQGDQLVAMDPESGRELWSRPLEGVLAQHGGHLASPPSVAGGNLYLATVTGDVVVVSQADGRLVDTVRLGAPMRFQPSVARGRLYVGSASGELVSVDLHDPRADGWPMWGGGPTHNGR